ncbi:MAG: hypothetical protein WCR97_05410 [Bacilli bacterium]
MKYKCLVCGSIIDNNEVCPFCGSDKTQIIPIEDKATTDSIPIAHHYRCLVCGKETDNPERCPNCGSNQLYDLDNGTAINTEPQEEVEYSTTGVEIKSAIGIDALEKKYFDLFGERLPKNLSIEKKEELYNLAISRGYAISEDELSEGENVVTPTQETVKEETIKKEPVKEEKAEETEKEVANDRDNEYVEPVKSPISNTKSVDILDDTEEAKEPLFKEPEFRAKSIETPTVEPFAETKVEEKQPEEKKEEKKIEYPNHTESKLDIDSEMLLKMIAFYKELEINEPDKAILFKSLLAKKLEIMSSYAYETYKNKNLKDDIKELANACIIYDAKGNNEYLKADEEILKRIDVLFSKYIK